MSIVIQSGNHRFFRYREINNNSSDNHIKKTIRKRAKVMTQDSNRRTKYSNLGNWI